MIKNEPPKSARRQMTDKSVQEQPSIDSESPNSSIEDQSMQHSKFELLSGYLDGELTQQEAQKVMLMLESDAEYKQLHDEMASMRHEIQSLSLQDSELEHLDKLFQDPVAKTSRIFGFGLILISSMMLVAFILYSVFINTAISLLVKVLIGLLGGGSLFLLLSVLRQRMIVNKNDKYNRVKI